MNWQDIDLQQHFEPGTNAPTNYNSAFYIVISDGEVLKHDELPVWQPLDQNEWQWSGLEAKARHYLGMISDCPLYVVEIDENADEPEGYFFDTLWSFLGKVELNVFYLIGRAKQIVDWYNNHQHCGQCGSATESGQADRSTKCNQCGLMFYPRLSPSIIVCINKGSDILLARNAQAGGNFYSTLAGFIEPGESIEETVHREVFEEVGLKVKNLRYFGSQSWPFPNSLMLGFHAEYESGEIVIQEEELSDAQWFHYNDLPNKPASISISGWLINDFIRRAELGQI